jgi:hypothetical protein
LGIATHKDNHSQLRKHGDRPTQALHPAADIVTASSPDTAVSEYSISGVSFSHSGAGFSAAAKGLGYWMIVKKLPEEVKDFSLREGSKGGKKGSKLRMEQLTPSNGAR